AAAVECEGFAYPGFNQHSAWLNRLGFVERLRSNQKYLQMSQHSIPQTSIQKALASNSCN
ncbi:hypothetical protein, partial [Rugamonas violacea]|uniref:hypothetical protein n=1 Tax=Rugamonas sp. CCM 8940 TaxID=2765359 RepID=UPI001F2C3252